MIYLQTMTYTLLDVDTVHHNLRIKQYPRPLNRADCPLASNLSVGANWRQWRHSLLLGPADVFRLFFSADVCLADTVLISAHGIQWEPVHARWLFEIGSCRLNIMWIMTFFKPRQLMIRPGVQRKISLLVDCGIIRNISSPIVYTHMYICMTRWDVYHFADSIVDLVTWMKKGF